MTDSSVSVTVENFITILIIHCLDQGCQTYISCEPELDLQRVQFGPLHDFDLSMDVQPETTDLQCGLGHILSVSSRQPQTGTPGCKIFVHTVPESLDIFSH